MRTDREGFEELDRVASQVCDRLCRYPVIWNERKMGPLSDSTVCDECPLVNLVKGVKINE